MNQYVSYVYDISDTLFAEIYRWTRLRQTTVRQTFGYDGRYAWSQSHAYQVRVSDHA